MNFNTELVDNINTVSASPYYAEPVTRMYSYYLRIMPVTHMLAEIVPTPAPGN